MQGGRSGGSVLQQKATGAWPGRVITAIWSSGRGPNRTPPPCISFSGAASTPARRRRQTRNTHGTGMRTRSPHTQTHSHRSTITTTTATHKM